MLVMAIGDRITELRTARKPLLTQERLAEQLGVARSTVAQWERNRNEPGPDMLRRLAAFFDVPPSYILDEPAPAQMQVREPQATYDRSNVSGGMMKIRGSTSFRVKIYGGISAGDGNTSPIDVDEIDIPAEFARDDYGALVIDGDSMHPFLFSSDIAIFRDWTQRKVGMITAARLENGDWVCKQMVYENGRYLLRSFNPKYPDITEGFQPMGYLVGIVRDIGPERLVRLNPYGLLPASRDTEKEM